MDVHLAVRFAHVLAAAVIVGGALLCWVLAIQGHGDGDARPAQVSAFGFAAERYEWAFWMALGLIVATGVGNLGAYGEALPPPGSAWGRVFALKLMLVTVLLLGSTVRTLAVARIAAGDGQTSLATLRNVYAATALTAMGVIAFAEYLAHA